MSPVLEHLTRSAAGRYRIDRELGRGGMATWVHLRRPAPRRLDEGPPLVCRSCHLCP